MGGTGKTMRLSWACCMAAAALATTTLVGCSSGTKGAAPTATTTTAAAVATTPVTPTSAPTAAEIAQDRAYLNGSGAKLVEYLRVTKVAVAPPIPSKAQCQQLANVTLPKVVRSAGVLEGVAARIANRSLRELAIRDVRTLNLFVAACAFQPPKEWDPQALRYMRDQRARLVGRLQQLGIAI